MMVAFVACVTVVPAPLAALASEFAVVLRLVSKACVNGVPSMLRVQPSALLAALLRPEMSMVALLVSEAMATGLALTGVVSTKVGANAVVPLVRAMIRRSPAAS